MKAQQLVQDPNLNSPAIYQNKPYNKNLQKDPNSNLIMNDGNIHQITKSLDVIINPGAEDLHLPQTQSAEHTYTSVDPNHQSLNQFNASFNSTETMRRLPAATTKNARTL
jgi:hypothetical protein